MSVALPVSDAAAGDPAPALICLSGTGECGMDIAAGIFLADVRLYGALEPVLNISIEAEIVVLWRDESVCLGEREWGTRPGNGRRSSPQPFPAPPP